MEPALFVMAIMGCADDGGDCRQQRLEPVRYTSIAACQEAMPEALGHSTDIDYPLITAVCRRTGAQFAAAPANARSGG